MRGALERAPARRVRSAGWLVLLSLFAWIGAARAACAAELSASDAAFIDRANALAGPLSGTTDAAAELAPAILAMAPAPASIPTVRAATLLTPASARWAEAEAWATGEPQKKALEVLARVTDPKAKYMFALKYGRAAADPAWVKGGFFVDLGDPPTLAGAKFLYLEKLDELSKLCTVEAARRVSKDDAKGAYALLTHWLRLGRMMADREFLEEKVWGFNAVSAAAERFRDLLYQNEKAFTPEVLIETVKELAERNLLLHRMRLPEGDRLAGEQLIARTITERGGPNPDTFAATLARLGAKGRPLTTFAEAAYWGQVESQHAGWFDVREQLDKVWGDWKKRWGFDNPNEKLLKLPTDYSRMDKVRFALVDAVMRPLGALIPARELLYLELSGTRMALAVMGFKRAQDQLPPNIKAVEPRFIKDNEPDFYNYDPLKDQTQVLRYWVPIRDQTWGERELPRPHEMTVFARLEASRAGADDATGAAAGVAALLFSIPAMPMLPKDVYDPEAGTLDTAKLRTILKGETRKQPIGKEEIDAITIMLKLVGGTSFGDTVRDAEAMRKFSEGYSKGIQTTLGGAFEQEIGISAEDFGRYLAEKSAAAVATPAWQKVINEKIRSNQAITADDVRRLNEAAIDAATRDDLVETYLKKMLPKLAPRARAGDIQFTKSVDDSQFLLYSVGPDRADDRARVVGRGGRDLLYWPPLISLLREHLEATK